MNLVRCPICQSDKVKTVTGKISFKTPGREVTIPKAKRVKCESCGEEFFDHEANKILDQYRGNMATIL